MKKNVLVIGGSYFAGKVFSIYASKNDALALHVVNRGKYSLNLSGVSEYKCDRHDVKTLSGLLPDIHFDAVVDFCGYTPGEIALIIDAFPGRVGQYVFISTASVYTATGLKKEDDPVTGMKPDTPDFEKEPVTVSRVMTENIPLPFPLDTDDLTNGNKMTRHFGFKYTSLEEGMAKTFAAFKPVFSS